MSDIHLDARREAEEAYPPTEHTAWNGLKYQAMPFKEREGFTKAALKYLPQLSDKDKVIGLLQSALRELVVEHALAMGRTDLDGPAYVDARKLTGQ